MNAAGDQTHTLSLLHIIPDLAASTGGPVTAIRSLVHAQIAAGRRVTLITTDYGLDDISLCGDVRVRICRCRTKRWRWSPDLRRVVREELARCDIAHIHTMWQYPTWVAAREARKARVPYVIEPAGMLAKWSLDQKRFKKALYSATFDRQTLAAASGVRGTSVADLLDSRVRQRTNQLFIVPHGVDISLGTGKDAFLRLYPELRDRRVVLFLGRLHPKKRPDVLIEAFASVAAKHADAHLVLAGPGEPEYVDELKRLVAALNVKSRTTFTGLLKGSLVHEAYRVASMFVLPSHHENFGLAVAEAMMEGCPVILSPGVDIAAPIAAEGAAIVAEPTPNALAREICGMLTCEPERALIGKRGAAYVLREYNWPSIADRLGSIYQDILENRRTSPDWIRESA